MFLDAINIFDKKFYAKYKERDFVLGLLTVFIILHLANTDPKFATQLFLMLTGGLAFCILSAFIMVIVFIYKKVFIVISRLHYMNLRVIECKKSCIVQTEVLSIVEPEVLTCIKADPVNTVEGVAVSIVESETLNQYVTASEVENLPFIQPDSSISEHVEEIPFVSLDETRKAIRVEAYLEVEHAAGYLGLSIKDFNQLAKIKCKVCGKEKIYKINNLNCFIQEMSAYAWTKNLNRTNQEKIISEHGLLSTKKVASFLNKSEKTLSNWRDSRENSCSEPYGPDFIKVNTSVFYYIHALLAWCDSPITNI
ncbi:MAG: hypothetical protein R3Y11_12070 [Pseudomonadota bacterium]